MALDPHSQQPGTLRRLVDQRQEIAEAATSIALPAAAVAMAILATNTSTRTFARGFALGSSIAALLLLNLRRPTS